MASISVKNVPAELVEKLRERAQRNHRSLQGELMVILEQAAVPATISLEEADRRIKALNFSTPDESTAWIRELRDAS